MENAKRSVMEIRDGVQNVRQQIKFLRAVFTSDISLDDEERAGAFSFFHGIDTQLSAVGDLVSLKAMAPDQGSAPS